MGFMGMSCITESDAASDFAASAGYQVAKLMTAELEVDNGQYNTPGVLNVALFFETFIVPSGELHFSDSLQRVAKQTRTMLRARINLSPLDEDIPDDTPSLDDLGIELGGRES